MPPLPSPPTCHLLPRTHLRHACHHCNIYRAISVTWLTRICYNALPLRRSTCDARVRAACSAFLAPACHPPPLLRPTNNDVSRSSICTLTYLSSLVYGVWLWFGGWSGWFSSFGWRHFGATLRRSRLAFVWWADGPPLLPDHYQVLEYVPLDGGFYTTHTLASLGVNASPTSIKANDAASSLIWTLLHTQQHVR